MKKRSVWITSVAILTFVALAIYVGRSMHETSSVTVGVLAPLTGGRSDAGEYMRNAVMLAQEDIATDANRHYKVTFVFEDTAYQAPTAVSATQKLLEFNRVQYIVGPYGTAEVLAVAPITEKARVILITPGSQVDDVSGLGDHVFRTIHHTAQEVPVFGDFVTHTMSGDTLHFLAVDNAFAESYLASMKPILERAGKKVGQVERFTADTEDFRTQLLKIKAENPKDVFPIATPKQMGLILKQADELGINAQFYHIGVEGPDLLTIAGERAEGLYYPYSYDTTSDQESVRSFVDRYIARFGAQPDTVVANTYDAVLLLSDCFEQVGTEVEAVKECLYNVRDYEGAGGTFSFDANGDATKSIIIKTVKDGKLVVHNPNYVEKER